MTAPAVTTTPTTAPASSPTPGSVSPALTFNQLEALWIKAGGPVAWAPVMAAIALVESSGDPNSNNTIDNNGKQTSWGLWQISDGTHNQPVPNINDPLTNARAAVDKFNGNGLWPWSGDPVARVFAGTHQPPSLSSAISVAQHSGQGGEPAQYTGAATPAADGTINGQTVDQVLAGIHFVYGGGDAGQAVPSSPIPTNPGEIASGVAAALPSWLGLPNVSWGRLGTGAAGVALIIGGVVFFLASTKPVQEAGRAAGPLALAAAA